SPMPFLRSSLLPHSSAAHRSPPSSPTRRSSDLLLHAVDALRHAGGERAAHAGRERPAARRPARRPARRRRATLAHGALARRTRGDRKSTRLNSSHGSISYAVFCLKKTKTTLNTD